MKIHEYQAKELLRKYGVVTPRGFHTVSVDGAVKAAEELGGKVWVVKAQIHAGGRGKGGGVKLARSLDEVRQHANDILGMQLVTHQTGPEGQKVRNLLIEEGADIKKEYYVAALTDRATQKVFHSIQGESTFAGEPCVFVRLTACDLRCRWCDTTYSFHEGRKMSIDEVMARVDAYGCPTVEITGGEPLLQADAHPLMARLLAEGKTVLIETGGHRSIAGVPEGVIRVMDIKCPGSGEAAKNDWSNLPLLTRRDQVKFVIADRADYEFARDVLQREGLAARCGAVHFSPVHGELAPRQLAEWILGDRLPVRLQLQMHKFIWDPQTRGV